MSRISARLCAAAALVVTAGCTSGKPTPTPTPTPVPTRGSVADRPPYLCYFIPQAAVADLTGYTGRLDAGDDKRDPDGYSCVISNDEQGVFITRYAVSAPRAVIENFLESGKDSNLVSLPPDLGRGGISNFEIRLYPYRRASAWFRCGSNDSLIAITVKRNPARDQDHDLIQLMRIAQRRFAEMFKCTPGGPPQG